MKIAKILFCLLFSLVPAGAGTRGIAFVHQPLTTLGTEMDAGIVVARIPVLCNAVPEDLLAHVSSPNRLVGSPVDIKDSNILSDLGIELKISLVKGAEYTVTMDLRKAGDPEKHGVSMEDLVAATIECINKTIVDTNIFHGDESRVLWNLVIEADEGTLSKLKRYQCQYDPRGKPQAEAEKRSQ